MKVTIMNGEVVIARPTSIYGAAVALRRCGARWAAAGLSPVVLVDGEPITPEQKATVNETWRPYLEPPSPARIEIG